MGHVKRAFIQLIIHYLRGLDYAAAQRVDAFVANSQATARRIRENYRRDSSVIYPPVAVEAFAPRDDISDYYLIVSRLAPYKRIDLVVQAFNELQLPLKIIGAGIDAARLQKMALPNIEFLGHVPQNRLADLYARCRATIFPGVEDFGLVPLEANAAGRPVIAYAAAGALETVVAGTTGVFFHEQNVKALAKVVSETDVTQFDGHVLRTHAEKFSKARFQEYMAEFVRAKWSQFNTRGSLPNA